MNLKASEPESWRPCKSVEYWSGLLSQNAKPRSGCEMQNIGIQLWFLELHDSPLELKGELQYLDENCHFRGEKMTILV